MLDQHRGQRCINALCLLSVFSCLLSSSVVDIYSAELLDGISYSFVSLTLRTLMSTTVDILYFY